MSWVPYPRVKDCLGLKYGWVMLLGITCVPAHLSQGMIDCRANNPAVLTPGDMFDPGRFNPPESVS